MNARRTPKGWFESFGEIFKFTGKIVREVLTPQGPALLRRDAAPVRAS